jgi:hypothetical protein
MNVFEDRVIFRLTKLLKHSRPGVHQKPIDLKSYPEKALCVVKCLEVYIHRNLKFDNAVLYKVLIM